MLALLIQQMLEPKVHVPDPAKGYRGIVLDGPPMEHTPRHWKSYWAYAKKANGEWVTTPELATRMGKAKDTVMPTLRRWHAWKEIDRRNYGGAKNYRKELGYEWKFKEPQDVAAEGQQFNPDKGDDHSAHRKQHEAVGASARGV